MACERRLSQERDPEGDILKCPTYAFTRSHLKPLTCAKEAAILIVVPFRGTLQHAQPTDPGSEYTGDCCIMSSSDIGAETTTSFPQPRFNLCKSDFARIAYIHDLAACQCCNPLRK